MINYCSKSINYFGTANIIKNIENNTAEKVDIIILCLPTPIKIALSISHAPVLLNSHNCANIPIQPPQVSQPK